MVDWESAQRAVHAFSGKWTMLVLSELQEQHQSYNMLVRATGLDTKTLNRCLRQLNRAGLISKETREEHAQGIAYHLTHHAKLPLDLLDELGHWWVSMQDNGGGHKTTIK